MKEYTQEKSHFNVTIVRIHSLIQVALKDTKIFIHEANHKLLNHKIQFQFTIFVHTIFFSLSENNERDEPK